MFEQNYPSVVTYGAEGNEKKKKQSNFDFSFTAPSQLCANVYSYTLTEFITFYVSTAFSKHGFGGFFLGLTRATPRIDIKIVWIKNNSSLPKRFPQLIYIHPPNTCSKYY